MSTTWQGSGQHEGWQNGEQRNPQGENGQPQYGQTRYGQPQYSQAQYSQDPAAHQAVSTPYPQAPNQPQPYGASYSAPAYSTPPYAATQSGQYDPVTHPGPPTDVMAIWAIISAVAGATVLLGLGSLAALVLAPIAIARIRKSGNNGMGLSIGALVLAVLTLIALIAVSIALVGFIMSMTTLMMELEGL